MISSRTFLSPGAAWLAAALGAWLAAASCRTLQPAPTTGTAGARGSDPAEAVPAPIVRVGVVVDGERASIGADDGVRVHARAPGENGVRLLSLARATFRPLPGGLLKLLETGDTLTGATIVAQDASELLALDAAPYRGVLEVRPGTEGRLTVVNVVNLEEYLRGVVPNELSPAAFPQIEALKAQAVAARTYVLAHLGEYAARGYDVCATPSCQVYRGQGSEHALSDRAVEETRGVVATFRGKPINAYYTSTCGGHTEDGKAIFDDAAPYLRGVACLPERSSRFVIRSGAPLRRELPDGPRAVRDVALLEALGVVDEAGWDPTRLREAASEAELRAWTGRLRTALHRRGCEAAPANMPATRAGLARQLVASLCWSERAERLLAPGDPDYLLQSQDAGRLAGAERKAVALLVREGVLSPFPDDTLRPAAPLTRVEAFSVLAGAALVAGAPGLREAEVAGLAGGQLSVMIGETAESHPLDPAVRLVRDLEGVHASAPELALGVGERVVFVVRDGRVVYLEAEQSRRGAAADRSSRYYNWEVRLTPQQVASAVSRYGSVGPVRDIVPRRRGVSGRVVELAVVGQQGELLLKGLRVRWGLGVRENLFVVNRELAADGSVERFVVTGKGWGHGVGLCQVGAFGMAQSGSTYDAILRHYYTGVEVGALR